MIAVVTGGSGFIGRNLVRRLLADGHEVRCLMRPGGGTPADGARKFVVRYDEPASLLRVEALEGADVVFHLAGVTKAVRPQAFTAGNVTPARVVLGALVARRLRPRFVYVSSQAAAGPAPARHRAIDEDDVPRPVEAYGRSKLDAERIVESFSDRVPVTTVRPAAVFGPYDVDFLKLFRFATRGVIPYPGTADHWLSLVHVDDVVQGMLLVAQAPHAISRAYFLSSAEPVQWRALGEEIANAVGRGVRHVNVPAPIVRAASFVGDVIGRATRSVGLANSNKAELARHRYWVCSAARARLELGFTESRSLPDAVKDTYYWYRQSGWLRGTRASHSSVA